MLIVCCLLSSSTNDKFLFPPFLSSLVASILDESTNSNLSFEANVPLIGSWLILAHGWSLASSRATLAHPPTA